MVWWKGNGHWLGLLVALAINSAVRTLGVKIGLPAGCIAAGLMVLALKNWAGEEASLYSIPTRIWPPVLFAFAGIAYYNG